MKTKEVMAPKKDEITWKSITNNIVKAIKNKRYDPVELLPKNVVDKIFDYIKGKELMTVSLVNHRWYNFIGKSERHMSKVEIRIVEPRTGRLPLFTMRDATFMTQNRRKYQNISLISLEFGLRTQHKLLLANFQWRIVRLICHGFKTQIDLNNFLGMIEPYVEELVLRSICIKKDILHTLEQNFTFPRLMKLSIRNCSAYVYNGPFNGVTNLYSLNIGTEYASKYSPGKHKGTLRNQGIQNIMLNNHYLDELELFLSQEDFDAIYMNERFLRNIRFSLYSLSVGCFIQQDNEGINIVQINNFIRFLESQKYLVELNLEKWLGILVLECSVNDMQLRGLTITTFEQFGQHNDSVDHLSLQRNQTIEHLRIWTQNNSVVKEIVNVCHELKVLEVAFVTQELFDIIVKNCPNLEVLICDSFTAIRPPINAVLKRFHYMEIRVSCATIFRDLIAYKGCNYSFEQVFLDAAWKLQKQINLEIMTNSYRRHSF